MCGLPLCSGYSGLVSVETGLRRGSVVGPERETVTEVETGAAEEYSEGCRCVQSRDERRGGRSLSGGAGDREKEMGNFCAEGRS
jgi:hypothetical protein